MTPKQAKRFLELQYLVFEYDVAKAYKARIPPIAHAIRKWRRELMALTALAEKQLRSR